MLERSQLGFVVSVTWSGRETLRSTRPLSTKAQSVFIVFLLLQPYCERGAQRESIVVVFGLSTAGTSTNPARGTIGSIQ